MRVEQSGLQEKGQLAYVFDTLALARGHIYVSPITINHEQGAHSAQGRPTLRLATPVADNRGTVVGVVVIDVDLARLLERLQVDLPGNYEVFLANEWAISSCIRMYRRRSVSIKAGGYSCRKTFPRRGRYSKTEDQP